MPIFATQTDTEVVAHLLAKYIREGIPARAAMLKMLNRVTGAYALVVMFAEDPNTLMAARSGPPLAIGHGRGEMFLGSDAIALAPFTNEITYLVDGDFAVLTRDGAKIFDFSGNPVSAPAADFPGRRPMWSTRAITGISWRRKSTSSRKSFPTRLATTWISPATASASMPRGSISRRSRALRFPPAAPPISPGSSANTGSSAMRACRSKSMSPPNSAIAKCRCRRRRQRSSSRNRAKPPIRWLRCAIARRTD